MALTHSGAHSCMVELIQMCRLNHQSHLFLWLRCDTSAPTQRLQRAGYTRLEPLSMATLGPCQSVTYSEMPPLCSPIPYNLKSSVSPQQDTSLCSLRRVTSYPSSDRKRTSTYVPRGKERQRIWLGEEEGRVRGRGEDICGQERRGEAGSQMLNLQGPAQMPHLCSTAKPFMHIILRTTKCVFTRGHRDSRWQIPGCRQYSAGDRGQADSDYSYKMMVSVSFLLLLYYEGVLRPIVYHFFLPSKLLE